MSGYHKTLTVDERLWGPAIAGPGGCIIWAGNTRYNQGYGRIAVNGSLKRVHVLAYEELVGPVPEDMILDHLCRNRACMNPHHLEPVTFTENVLRGESFAAANARKTHCVRGHEFTEANTIRRPKGRRGCRACGRVASKRYRDKKGVAA